MAALKYPFNRPSPWTNLLLVAVCMLIPVVGPIVVMGYGIILEKTLVMDLNAQPVPFDFNKFTYYLERGVILFVVSLVLSLCYLPVIFGVYAAFFIVVFVFQGSPAAIAVTAVIVFLGLLLTGVIFSTLVMGVAIRASLVGDFKSAFNFAWILDFFKRVGWTSLGYCLLFTLISIPLLFAGACALYVGMFFAVAYLRIAGWHLQMQLYHLYLDRGGTPLAIKPEPPPPAFPVVMP